LTLSWHLQRRSFWIFAIKGADILFSTDVLLEYISDFLDEHGIRLNVIGRVELFPKSVQRAIREAEKKTQHNNRYV